MFLGLMLTGCATTDKLAAEYQKVVPAITGSQYHQSSGKTTAVEETKDETDYRLFVRRSCVLTEPPGYEMCIRAKKMDEQSTKFSVRYQQTAITSLCWIPYVKKTRDESMERHILSDIEKNLNLER